MSQNYQVNLSVSPFQIQIPPTGVPFGTQLIKAGILDLPLGSDTASVNFVTPLPNAVGAYVVSLTLVNTIDTFPMELNPRVSGFSQATLTVKVPAVTDTSNYHVHWNICGAVNG